MHDFDVFVFIFIFVSVYLLNVCTIHSCIVYECSEMLTVHNTMCLCILNIHGYVYDVRVHKTNTI